MKKSRFSLAKHKGEFVELIKKFDHQTLAVWAIDCAERVLPYFEGQYPEDPRPRQAIGTLQAWIDTGSSRWLSYAGLRFHLTRLPAMWERIILPAPLPVQQVRQWQRHTFPLIPLVRQFMHYKPSIEPATPLKPTLPFSTSETGNINICLNSDELDYKLIIRGIDKCS
jgi:hypothetical protein